MFPFRGRNRFAELAVSAGEANRYTLVASNAFGSVENSFQLFLSGSGISAISAGRHSLFVDTNGSLWATGENGLGQLGDGNNTDRFSYLRVVDENVTAVAAGYLHSLFLKKDGTLWAMGQNSDGQLGDGTNTSRSVPTQVASDVVAVAAGWHHSMFLKDQRFALGDGKKLRGATGHRE